jgi:exosome complex RNA-binding protein Rrp4
MCQTSYEPTVASITAIPRSINLSTKTYNLRVSIFWGKNGKVWTKDDERGKEEEESIKHDVTLSYASLICKSMLIGHVYLRGVWLG